MNAQQLSQASEMWEAGAMGKIIAERFGETESRFWKIIDKHRDLFPRRARYVTSAKQRQVALPAAKRERPDTMNWITQSGAEVTLPRVKFLEGKG